MRWLTSGGAGRGHTNPAPARTSSNGAAGHRCDPESAPILNHLGAARLQAGNASGAASAFTLALQFQPDFVEASVNLALALLAQGRCDDSTSRRGLRAPC